MPSWIRSLAHNSPFVLSFESRQCVFHSTALDRDRAVQRLTDSLPELNSDGPDGQTRIAPRLERRKVSIQREDLLKQAEAVLASMDGANRAVLEVQYQNEEGTGLGPTLEFYALVSKELQKARLGLWRDGHIGKREDEEALVKSLRLYPVPLTRVVKQASVAKIRSKFNFIGRLLARALIDSRMVSSILERGHEKEEKRGLQLDLPLSPVLYKWLLGEERTLGLGDLWELDGTLAETLASILGPGGGDVEELVLDFTLPGTMPPAELRKGGKDMAVTASNIGDYVRLVTHWILFEGVSRQLEALVEGFDSVLPVKHLRLFYAEEMEALFCGSLGAWEAATLAAHIRPDHGYTYDSHPIQWLIQIMAAFDDDHRRRFLHFITGSPKLPVGGFKVNSFLPFLFSLSNAVVSLQALQPPLTVVRKGCGEGEEEGDKYLPSVMTCVNYLKLPHYSSKDVMADRLDKAIRWGQNSFHLS